MEFNHVCHGYCSLKSSLSRKYEIRIDVQSRKTNDEHEQLSTHQPAA